MKIALIGATGFIGSRILDEALRRGHQVTAITRNPEKVPARGGVTAQRGDVFDEAGLARLLAGHDVVISAVHFLQSDAAKLLGAVRQSSVQRYLVVGGAGSLRIGPGQDLVDSPHFPPQYKDEASKGRDFLNLLRGETGLDWTFLSPAALIEPGARTGKFRLGKDDLVTDAAGESRISAEDYAVALLDEVEQPRHIRQRFTLAY
jgi:putative NADH-flavin reductase